MLLRNIFNSRMCYAPDEGGGSAVHDDTEDIVREDATVNGGGDPGEETQDDAAGTGSGDEPAGDAVSEDAGADAGVEDLATALQAAGLPTDPRQLIAGLTQLRQQSSEAQQLRAMLWQQMQQAQKPTQQAPPPAPEKPKMPWELPQFDRGMLQMLTTDENGNIVPKPGADPTLADKYRQWNTAREAALDKFLQDPYGALQGGIQPLVQQEAMRIVQEQFQRQQQEQMVGQYQARLQKFESENRSWTHDPITGALTPMGKLWDDNFRYSMQLGHRDPFAAADAAVDAELARQQWIQQQQEAANAPPPPTPVEKRKQEQLAFVKGRNQPNRSGSMRRQNGKKSPAQDYDPFKKLREDLAGVPLEDLRKN